MQKNKKVILLILDGWGIAPKDKYNAIDNAKTPNFDRLIREYPNTQLKSDGEAVGLQEGQFGTSEINHLTIGSGKIILQDLPRIDNAINDKSFFDNSALLELIKHAQINKSKLHLIGILSDGGVHSHINHLFAIFDLLEQKKFRQSVNLHLFSDGRDVPPISAEKYLKKLDQRIAKSSLKIKIASLQGRFLLDRDRDWEKTETAFETLIGKARNFSNWQAMLNFDYHNGIKDEFFPPSVFSNNAKIEKNDAIFFFHYRTDRQYQLLKRIYQEKLQNIKIGSFVKPSDEFNDLYVAYPRLKIENTLARTISENNKTQLHLTETEKFPHLTYFLNGERESEFTGETWKMISSNRFVKPYYNFEPSMQNFNIAEHIIESIEFERHDFLVANFASPDMVGHTGSYEGAVISAESIDYCLGKIYNAVQTKLDKFALIVTADHGNSEIMWDYKNNQPHTQHTLSPVPFILVSDLDIKLQRRESLSDIAPTILELMSINKPLSMTGSSLINWDK